AAEPGSFGEWLRHLPLKPRDSGVTLHDGRPVADHGTVAAVIDIDAGRSDLQQCADAVMRLRAEYLFSHRLIGLIGFELYSGERYRTPKARPPCRRASASPGRTGRRRTHRTPACAAGSTSSTASPARARSRMSCARSITWPTPPSAMSSSTRARPVTR